MKQLKRFLLTTLIGGFVVLLPLALFYFLLKLVLGLVVNILNPLSAIIEARLNLDVPSMLIDVMSFVIVIAFCFIVGLFIRTKIGKDFFDVIERNYLYRLPLYGTIKETVQQFTGVKKMPFTDVVLVDVFSNGVRMLGFVTDEHDTGNFTVFVPTGPNPTNGFIFHVPKENVEHLSDTHTDDAMRTIIGVGVGSAKVFKY